MGLVRPLDVVAAREARAERGVVAPGTFDHDGEL
jgi:hypothetical protein